MCVMKSFFVTERRIPRISVIPYRTIQTYAQGCSIINDRTKRRVNISSLRGLRSLSWPTRPTGKYLDSTSGGLYSCNIVSTRFFRRQSRLFEKRYMLDFFKISTYPSWMRVLHSHSGALCRLYTNQSRALYIVLTILLYMLLRIRKVFITDEPS